MGLKWFSGVVGVIFLMLGILGLFINELWGFIHFDIAHNILHLTVGIVGLLAALTTSAAKLFAKVLGIVYILLGILGFFIPELFGHLMLEMFENILHLVVGGIALYVGFVDESNRVVKSSSQSKTKSS